MSYLVENPKDRFSHDWAHFTLYKGKENFNNLSALSLVERAGGLGLCCFQHVQ